MLADGQPLSRQSKNGCSDYDTRSQAPGALSQSPPLHCSCLTGHARSCSGELCSCALFSEGHREPAGTQSCVGWAAGAATAHLQAEQSGHMQLSLAHKHLELHLWITYLSLLLAGFTEHETTKEHTPVEESQLTAWISAAAAAPGTDSV